MSSILFIRPQQTPTTSVDWLLRASSSSTPLQQGTLLLESDEDKAALQKRAENTLTVLIIPGHQARWFNVPLPSKQRALLNSLPFLIEEQISTPIEQIHVAAGDYHAGHINGLALPHEAMQSWIAWLAELSIEAHIITADFELIKSADLSPQAITVDDEHILVHSSTTHASMSPPIFNAIKPRIEIDTQQSFNESAYTDQALLSLMAENFSLKNPPINLLCNQYQSQNAAQKWLSLFKLPLAAAAVLALIFFSSIVIDNLQMQRQVDQLDQAMVAIYKEAFPEARRINNPVGQMRGALKQLNQSGNGTQFIEWLAAAAPHIKQSGVTILNLRFSQSPDILRLQLQASDYATMEQVNSAIAQTGLKADLGTLTRNQDNVSGLLTISAQ